MQQVLRMLKRALKWNEASFITQYESPLRIDWKKSKPYQYSMYFNCKTKLVETFRELFSDRLSFEGNREIVFKEHEVVDVEALK